MPLTPKGSPSPKSFVSRLTERATKSRTSKMPGLAGLSNLGGEGVGGEVEEKVEKEPNSPVPQSLNDALGSLDNIIVGDAADKWKRRATDRKSYEEKALFMRANVKDMSRWGMEDEEGDEGGDEERVNDRLSPVGMSPMAVSRGPMVSVERVVGGESRSPMVSLVGVGPVGEEGDALGDALEEPRATAFDKINEILKKLKDERGVGGRAKKEEVGGGDGGGDLVEEKPQPKKPSSPPKEQVRGGARSSRTSRFLEKAQAQVVEDEEAEVDVVEESKFEDEEVKSEAVNIASKLSSSVKKVIQRAPMSSAETKSTPIPLRAGFVGGKILRMGRPGGGVGKKGLEEEVKMLEQDLMNQLNEQKSQRDNLLNLAKAGGSFRGLGEEGGEQLGGLPFLGKTRGTVFRDRAVDILDEVKKQKLLQAQMGSFSQLDR